MATAEPEGVERYNDLCQKIEQTFSEYHSTLEWKKNILLDEVKKMKDLFLSYKDIDKAIKQLETAKKVTDDILTENLVARAKGDVENVFNTKIAIAMSDKSNYGAVCDFEFLTNSVEVLNSISKIHLRSGSSEFSQRIEPIVMNGKRGVGEGFIASPRGVAVDEDLIYIVDHLTNIVSIYSLEGDYLKNFGKGKLIDPYGICLSQNAVFVTNRGNNSVSKFLKSGHFVNNSTHSNPGLQLGLLSNLCTHNIFVYVCNRSKHRIEVLDCSNLKFKQSFGQGMFHCPEDIKVRNDKLFIITQYEKLIHTFTTDFQFVSSISLSTENIGLCHVSFFTVDLNCNFIISNLQAGRLEAFSHSGEYIASLGDVYLRLPGGVAVDGSNRIVTISQSDNNSIQIY